MNRLDVCINGLEMLHLIQNAYAQGISYRLIFTDFSMPRMDGVEAVSQIKEFYKEKGVPAHEQPYIIGLTGHVHEEYEKLGIQAGMDEVVSKPLYYQAMVKIMRKFF